MFYISECKLAQLILIASANVSTVIKLIHSLSHSCTVSLRGTIHSNIGQTTEQGGRGGMWGDADLGVDI